MEFLLSNDKDYFIVEECSNEVAFANLAEATFSKRVRLDERSDEVRLYSQNISFNNMVMFYEESAPKTSAVVIKKKSLIKRAWEAITRMFSKIRQHIFKKKLQNIPNDVEFVVPTETVKEIKTFKSETKNLVSLVKRFCGKVKNSKLIVSIITTLTNIKKTVSSGFKKISEKIKLRKKNRENRSKDIPDGYVLLAEADLKEMVDDLNDAAFELENLSSSTLPNDEMSAVDELHDITGKASPATITFTPSEIAAIKWAAKVYQSTSNDTFPEIRNNVDACCGVRHAVSEIANDIKTVAYNMVPENAENSSTDEPDDVMNESFNDRFNASKAAAIAAKRRRDSN